MHLVAMVLTLCSLQTLRCENYVVRLYEAPPACQFDALGIRQLRRAEPVFVRCIPTTR